MVMARSKGQHIGPPCGISTIFTVTPPLSSSQGEWSNHVFIGHKMPCKISQEGHAHGHRHRVHPHILHHIQ